MVARLAIRKKIVAGQRAYHAMVDLGPDYVLVKAGAFEFGFATPQESWW